MTAALTAGGLTYRYRPASDAVLRDVGLSVAPGEVVGVLGANGAGKSTLLRLLAGLAAPESGAVMLGDVDVRDIPRATLARRVAYLAQRERVAPGSTTEDVVSLGRAPHTGWLGVLSRVDREAVASAMTRCELAGFGGRAFATLSGGEQKRCLVARALAQQPAVMLLDEPVAALDLAHQLAVCDLLAERARGDGVAVVVALHELNLAARYCDRLLVLRRGAAPIVASVGDVFTRATLRELFGVRAWVETCPEDGRPFQVALRREA